MKTYSAAEKQKMKETARAYSERVKKQKTDAIGLLCDELHQLMDDAVGMRYSYKNFEPSALYIQLRDGLKDGTYKAPSEFFEKHCCDLFDGVIYPHRKKHFYYAVDHLHEWAYGRSYSRRSYRTNNPDVIVNAVMYVLRDFSFGDLYDAELYDIITGNLPEDALAKRTTFFIYDSICEYLIPAEIDSGNEKIIQLMKDILLGDSDIPAERYIYRGVLNSRNSMLHEIIGKTLVAARLQEGLRQTICESMDCASVDGFMTLLEVIEKNNFIRFSSVKRAVGTWLGLLYDDVQNLDRISEKSITLIYNCLKNPETHAEYLASEDCLKIFIALWAYGFYEVDDMIAKIIEISENGTRHQLLTAGYVVNNLDNAYLKNKVSRYIIEKYADDPQILAMYLPDFMHDCFWISDRILYPDRFGFNSEKNHDYTQRKYCSLEPYFESTKDAEKFYGILNRIYDSIKGKSIVYPECVFPWNTASLEKNDVVFRLGYIASILRDNDKIDEVCPKLAYADPSHRKSLFQLLLVRPETEIQRHTLTAALCDKAEYPRHAAAEIIKSADLMPENYLQMEDMLKYKASDARASIVQLLYRQDDTALHETVHRLLSDKKEERRTGGLDIVLQLSANSERTDLFRKCLDLLAVLKNPSTKEQILIDAILAADSADSSDAEPLFNESDAYCPAIAENEYTAECIKTFMHYFPDSQLSDMVNCSAAPKISDKQCCSAKTAQSDCEAFNSFIGEHRYDEYVSVGGETTTVGNNNYAFSELLPDGSHDVALFSLWDDWYKENINSKERLIRAFLYLCGFNKSSRYFTEASRYVCAVYGGGFDTCCGYLYWGQLFNIMKKLISIYVSDEDMTKMKIAVILWYAKCVPDEDVYVPDDNENAHLASHSQLRVMMKLECKNDSIFDTVFPLMVNAAQKTFTTVDETSPWNKFILIDASSYNYSIRVSYRGLHRPPLETYILAAYKGLITKENMYHYLFHKDNLGDALFSLSNLIIASREKEKLVKDDSNYGFSLRINQVKNTLQNLFGKRDGLADDDIAVLDFASEIYETVTGTVLSAELRRGDSETQYSAYSHNIRRIYGAERFVAILCSLGKDTIERSYFHSETKKGSLSHLLSVCIPNPADDAAKLDSLLKNTDITEKRLIEAALYSPEWIDIIGEYLGWNGFKSACYYFIAHMNEQFDDRTKAIIAKYTPLSSDDLNLGAFDVDWFKSAYETIGEERFDMIYDAAKYITSGIKHARARKYADAVLGKLDTSKTCNLIADKRNKDLLMAYSLIPLSGEDDICERYLYLQKFLKESRKFGAQRSASEKSAVEISMQNLATNAGYTDTTRLTLRMETKLIDDSRDLFCDKEIEDIVIRLNVNESGTPEVICTKGGKALKSIPAKLKKNEHIIRINETKKRLTEQYRRTKHMLEAAMEDCIEFTVSELDTLCKNPVIAPLVKNLVFAHNGKFGFLDSNKLTDYSGNAVILSDNDSITVSHPYHLYIDGHWSDYQKYIFENHIIQPFKQVFRELYIKTAEEEKMNHSLRYSGHQIQPSKTKAALKTRRWVADIDDGLQKVYYKENIIARIYAMADWFSPADVEAPTLEWVEFSDRKTGEPITINKIPDIIFSEVMRDVDLAVSVAYVGGVDPETSHSTIEMRASLLEFTLPLFKLENVTVKATHAHIEGKLANYSVHLGSGVVHKEGGAMINILPVHSQHRGKLFLPFVDDDPKTAEILTKVLFLAEDKKIKDPSIIEQILY